MGIDRRVFLGGAGAIIGRWWFGLAEAGTPRSGRTDHAQSRTLSPPGFVGQADHLHKGDRSDRRPLLLSSPLRRDITDRRPGEKLRLRISVGGLSLRGCRSPARSSTSGRPTPRASIQCRTDHQPVDTSTNSSCAAIRLPTRRATCRVRRPGAGLGDRCCCAAPVRFVARRTTAHPCEGLS